MFVGWDWASAAHDVTVIDGAGKLVDRWRLSIPRPVGALAAPPRQRSEQGSVVLAVCPFGEGRQEGMEQARASGIMRLPQPMILMEARACQRIILDPAGLDPAHHG
jgi:hypothetical protein